MRSFKYITLLGDYKGSFVTGVIEYELNVF